MSGALPTIPLDYDAESSVASQVPQAGSVARSLHDARLDVDTKIAMHGSIEKWPTLSLLPNQFPLCVCGCSRLGHRWVGTERGRCNKKGCRCHGFQAAGLVRERATRGRRF